MSGRPRFGMLRPWWRPRLRTCAACVRHRCPPRTPCLSSQRTWLVCCVIAFLCSCGLALRVILTSFRRLSGEYAARNEVLTRSPQAASALQLKLASLNPGRTGLAALGSNQLIHWRIQAIAATLLEENIDICALPGARFPPGAQLPANFPFAWVGVQSLSWGTVGVLVRADLELEVESLAQMDNDRVLWLRVRGPDSLLHVCAF